MHIEHTTDDLWTQTRTIFLQTKYAAQRFRHGSFVGRSNLAETFGSVSCTDVRHPNWNESSCTLLSFQKRAANDFHIMQCWHPPVVVILVRDSRDDDDERQNVLPLPSFCDNQNHPAIIERFSKPNFCSIRRFRTMTGLEIENWIEKCGRTVRKFRLTRPRTESNFRFGLTSCRSQNLSTEVRRSFVRYSTFFSRNLIKLTPCLTPPRIYPKSVKVPFDLADDDLFLLRQQIFGRFMAIISAWMGKGCWPWDHQWSSTWQPPDLHSHRERER